MRVLFDRGTPVPLRRHRTRHEVRTAYELGWSTLTNGDLLERAEAESFDVLVTTDSNLRYQQNLGNRRVAIVVLKSTSWPRIQRSLDAVIRAVEGAAVGTYVEVAIP